MTIPRIEASSEMFRGLPISVARKECVFVVDVFVFKCKYTI